MTDIRENVEQRINQVLTNSSIQLNTTQEIETETGNRKEKQEVKYRNQEVKNRKQEVKSKKQKKIEKEKWEKRKQKIESKNNKQEIRKQETENRKQKPMTSVLILAYNCETKNLS